MVPLTTLCFVAGFWTWRRPPSYVPQKIQIWNLCISFQNSRVRLRGARKKFRLDSSMVSTPLDWFLGLYRFVPWRNRHTISRQQTLKKIHGGTASHTILALRVLTMHEFIWIWICCHLQGIFISLQRHRKICMNTITRRYDKQHGFIQAFTDLRVLP